MQTILVSGVAGFIGSSFVRLTPEKLMEEGLFNAASTEKFKIIALDKLTYAGRMENIAGIPSERMEFVQGDIGDTELVTRLLNQHKPIAVVNFAAESHVDNSITGPGAFVNTNVVGVFNLLEATRLFWKSLASEEKKNFRFVQVSTDEVFGALQVGDPKFTENTSYAPNSPYSASKAAADHLVRAWFHTYGLPTIITNCSNNYGPRQFPEKLIPRMIMNALEGKPLPVYGAGLNIRDWIHVEDHCRGVWLALLKGKPGEVYCFGGNSEKRNIDVVHAICDILQAKRSHASGGHYRDLIQFVEDRAGHDFRYAIDDSKAQKDLGYKREFLHFEAGLEATVNWYLENTHWIKAVTQ